MDIEQVFETVGYRPEEGKEPTAEDFKAFIDGTFKDTLLAPDKANLGKRMNVAQQAAMKAFKIGKSDGTFDDIESVVKFAAEKHEAALKEAQESAGKNETEKITELNGQIEELKGKFASTDTARLEAVKALEDQKKTWEQEQHNDRLSKGISKIIDGVPVDFQGDKVREAGYSAMMAGELKFALKEGGDISADDIESQIAVTDATGKPIPHPATSGKFLSPSEAVEAFAKKHKVLKVNDRQPPRTIKSENSNGNAGNGNVRNYLASASYEAAKKRSGQ